MRAFLFADLLQRVLRVVGEHEINWVMNITNIDDKTIRDSGIGSNAWFNDMGTQTNDHLENLLKLTEYYFNSFIEDIGALGINSKHFYDMPKATDFIPQMQDLIRRLISKGFAYVSEGSVYFNVTEWRKVDIYGKLFKIDFDNFKAGTRVDSDQYEREQVSDFALWKAKKSDEPFWKFEIDGVKCDGRPGWHIECSVMEKELLGLPFDIHTGGIDLKFPHHEDEIAQSKAGYGVDPTSFWCHNEFLEVGGEKMSKSLNNFFTLRDLVEKGIDPADIRFSMLSAHYGSIFNFTFDGVAASRKARLRIQDYIWDLLDENLKGDSEPEIEQFKNDTFGELANDLHTPKALANIFIFINQNPAEKIKSEIKADLVNFFIKLNDIFQAWVFEPRKIEFPEEVVTLAELRLKARKEKNFAESDVLRQKISDVGFAVKDTKDGYKLTKL